MWVVELGGLRERFDLEDVCTVRIFFWKGRVLEVFLVIF